MGIRNKKVPNSNTKLTRKQIRKEKRKEKKVKRNEFYTNRTKIEKLGSHLNINDCFKVSNKQKSLQNRKQKFGNLNNAVKTSTNKVLSIEEIRNKEQREKNKLQKEMSKQRKKHLLDANIEEDRSIRQLEKQLKLNKRKTKSVPKSFAEDGLDYLLEVCDSETMKTAISTEQELSAVNNEFEEDFALMTGQAKGNKIDKDSYSADDNSVNSSEENEESEYDLDTNSEDCSDEESITSETSREPIISKQKKSKNKFEQNNRDSDENNLQNEKGECLNKQGYEKYKTAKKETPRDKLKTNKNKSNNANDDVIEVVTNSKKRRNGYDDVVINKKTKIISADSCSSNNEDFSTDGVDEGERFSEGEIDEEFGRGAVKKNKDGTWEDIYGRLRARDGTIINKTEEKYVPPKIRVALEMNKTDNKIQTEKITRLKKQLKGLLNRLAESNMHNIASQIENLYMNNSRNDMNETLTSLITESLVSEVITPERLLMEHVILIIILHANVGTEVGAHFLQCVVKKFDEFLDANHEVENKKLDNIVNIISQLYNFKLFDAKLLYDILYKLTKKFEEKHVECILHILRSVGFTLRKDDPLALKNFILDIQKQAAHASNETKDNPRVKFMLDILLAIKNNNVTKIPNYDTSYSEHLKKVMKGFIRKGNYVTQLNISLEDLIKADERGRWWVVGSAWAGNFSENTEKVEKTGTTGDFSEKLLALAQKQRMNTDTRRNIFCILMSAEDYLDAFEKLLRLGLKNQQEREIINIILHCCLQEKQYNPYYAVLAQKFCEYDRKYQMTIKCSIWDKLKSLGEHSGNQLSNLAKMLTYLFIEKGLPISTLKIMEFSELDKVTLRFMRQILLGILLHKDNEACLSVFEKVAQSDKLKLFRESLRLFIHHFLLRNLKSGSILEEHKSLLETRAKLVEKVLVSKENKVKF